MDGKLSKIINSLFLFILIIIIVYFIFTNSNNIPVSSPACLDNGLGSSFFYESCYDAYSKTIFLGIKRGFDNFKINGMSVSFFDFSEKKYQTAPPIKGGEEVFKISSEKNPKNLEIVLDIDDKNICQVPKKIFINYCPERIASGINASVNPLKNTTGSKFKELGSFSYINADRLSLTLAEKERIWGAKCTSVWSCTDWEECGDGLQKRTCRDRQKCSIPTDVPGISRYCKDNCEESWECEWTQCINGVSSPACMDINNCGTNYSIPKEIKCSDVTKKCVPDINCLNWTECEIDYNFYYLNNIDVENITGIKSRVCSDKNLCALPAIEERSCSLGIDVYTKVFRKCGAEFIGLYNKLNNELITRIDRGTSAQPHIDIVLDGENEFCDYCFDGVLNGDEERIDCGGSCRRC